MLTYRRCLQASKHIQGRTKDLWTLLLNILPYCEEVSYYKQQFELNKINLKTTWKLIGTITNRKPKGHTVPAKLHYNGKTYNDKDDIVNQSNE